MATLDEILAKISDDTLKREVAEVVDAEKERGIAATHKKNTENKKLRDTLIAAGYDSTKHTSYEAWITESKSVRENLTVSTGTNDELKTQLQLIRTELSDQKEATRATAQRAKDSQMKAILTDKIGNKFIGSSFLIKDLISEGRVDLIDDTLIFKDGEDSKTLASGIKLLEEEHKDMLKANIKAGSGKTGGDSPDIEEKSFADLLKEQMKK